MNVWFWAAVVMSLGLLPCAYTCMHGDMADRLVGLEMAAVLESVLLLVLAEAFHRSILFDCGLMLAVMSFGGGLVFARFLERWL